MSDKFTIEGLGSAWNRVNGLHGGRDMTDRALDDLIAELTRPQWKAQVGEVGAVRKGNSMWTYYGQGENLTGVEPDDSFERRPLTPDEVPALKVAIKYIQADDPDGNCFEVLAEIAKLTGEDMP